MQSLTTRRTMRLTILLFMLWPAVADTALAQAFVNFETPHVHPLDLAPNGRTLAAVNTSDNRLEIYDVAGGRPVHRSSVFVGLDPVSVRFLTNNIAWVVNHVSDSVSVVHVGQARVLGTIATLDEPADVVFAGRPQRAYVSCSQVDQVMVFNPKNLRAAPRIVEIEGEDPRALAVSGDRLHVYVAVFESGNGSTVLMGGLEDDDDIRDVVPANVVSDPAGPYGGQNPPPNAGSSFNPPMSSAMPSPPPVAQIVKQDERGRWMDDNGADWTAFVSGAQASRSGRPEGWHLIDHDVAVIDTTDLSVSYVEGLMNANMALAVNPRTGAVSVVGTDAINEVRFEPNLNGTFLRVNVALAEPSGATSVVDLNPHLTYRAPRIPQAERTKSIGDPRGIAWNGAGTRAYITGMGSNNVIVIDAAGRRKGQRDTIRVGQGPTGVVYHRAQRQLYVLNRFDASISVVDADREVEVERVRFFDPTPPVIRNGRPHLYDTHRTSGLGHVSCGSCHVDARMDRLAWDLGAPNGEMKSMDDQNMTLDDEDFFGNQQWHPMKGPMTTQTLQDIIGHEPHHWRGDRDGLEEFADAFHGLLGDDAPLGRGKMRQFEDFLATIHFPPNPLRELDNSLPTDVDLTGHFSIGKFSAAGTPLPNGNAQRGLTLFRTAELSGDADCVTCHSLPTGAGTPARHLGNDQFEDFPLGPNGESHLALIGEDASVQLGFKIPHLRNLYDKVGFETTQARSRAGFGFLHDGSIDSLSRFVSAFQVDSDQEVADLVALMLSFAGSDFGTASGTSVEPPGSPSLDVHAAVGRQVTISGAAQQSATIEAMVALARAGDVDLVVKGALEGVERGAVYRAATDDFQIDEAAVPGLSLAAVRELASPVSKLTFTVVPRGSGERIGVDRDRDGVFDFDEMR